MLTETETETETETSTLPRSSELSDWFATPLGQYVIDVEQSYFDREVADVFGFNAFQIGLPEHDFLRANRMPFRCFTSRDGKVSFAADSRALPIRSGVADLIILPHAIEFSENPHQVLREVQRVLMPEGHVMLSAIRPAATSKPSSASQSRMRARLTNWPRHG